VNCQLLTMFTPCGVGSGGTGTGSPDPVAPGPPAPLYPATPHPQSRTRAESHKILAQCFTELPPDAHFGILGSLWRRIWRSSSEMAVPQVFSIHAARRICRNELDDADTIGHTGGCRQTAMCSTVECYVLPCLSRPHTLQFGFEAPATTADESGELRWGNQSLARRHP